MGPISTDGFCCVGAVVRSQIHPSAQPGVLKGLLGLLIERGLHGNQDCSGDHGANHDVQAEQRDVVGGKGDDKATVRDVAVDALEGGKCRTPRQSPMQMPGRV